MTAIQIGTNNTLVKLLQTGFDSERQLQDVLCEHPTLLALEAEEFTIVGTEIVLPDTGRLDILMVDKDARLTIVEVKMISNTQVRREVAAQAMDYVSALLTQGFERIRERVAFALQSLSITNDDDIDRLLEACENRLHAGDIRTIIAVDSAPDSLVRLVRDQNRASKREVRLVEVQRYTSEAEDILIPRVLVRRSQQEDFRSVVVTYDALAPAELRTRGRAKGYRQIHPPGWPSGIHYEFLASESEHVGVEFHVEERIDRGLGPAVWEVCREKLRNEFKPLSVIWDKDWRNGRIEIPVLTRHPRDPAEVMNRLILLTREDVAALLEERGMLS